MDELLYERVAAHVEALIARGTLRGGARAPSVRKLARQQRCSVATAVLAYRTLEAKGVLEARPQSGHYVRIAARPPLPEPRATRTLAAPAAPAVSSLVAKVYGAARDPRVVNFGTAVPAAALLPVERLGRIVARLARTELAQHIHYDVPPGNVHLRRQIARRSVEWGCALGEDDFVTTVGAMEALHLALRAVTQPGDVIAVESPTYYGLLQLIESLGLRVVEIPAHPGVGLDLAALEEALAQHRVRAVLAMPNFNNPLGSLMPEANKKELVEMLARREIPLIEDDLYGDLHHQGERPRSAKAFDRDGNVLLCGSVSKTIAPGFRVGWIAPGRHRDRVEALKFAQSVGTPPLLQVAVAELMEAGGYDRHLRGMRTALAAQVQHTRDAIATLFPPGTRVSRPQGGFVLWVELPHGVRALDVHQRALAARISVAPGPIFSARGKFSGYLRLSCGHPWTPELEAAVRTLGQIVEGLGARPLARTA
ncbi:MAG: PLP-dependent aminotransferase family protein [Myxococcales bacterium]|nr:PLP-dependent aminotransferase family protein [Myxococcales bacterium]